jgi:hypothetical protein
MGTAMSETSPARASVAVLSRDPNLARRLGAWFGAHDPDLSVTLTAERWGDLLQSDGFPADLVVLDASIRSRTPVESRVRTLRASGSLVIVLRAAGGDRMQRAASAGAFCVLDSGVPLGLIDEMARAAVGLPLARTPD